MSGVTTHEADHQDSVLIAELSRANTQVARYVLAHLDADAGRPTPVTPEGDLALAARLEDAALALRRRVAGPSVSTVRRRTVGAAGSSDAEVRHHACDERHPVEGELCACGRPATVVYLTVNEHAEVAELPRCRGRVGAWVM